MCELKLRDVQTSGRELSYLASIILINSIIESDRGNYQCHFFTNTEEQVYQSSAAKIVINIPLPRRPGIRKECRDVTAHWGGQAILSASITQPSREFLQKGGEVNWFKDSLPINIDAQPNKYRYVFADFRLTLPSKHDL